MASSDDPITVPIERYITQLLDEVYFYKGGILLQVSEWAQSNQKRFLFFFCLLPKNLVVAVNQQRSNFINPTGRLATTS